MVNYVGRYKKIVRGLVEKSFSELKDKNIWVGETSERVSKKCSAVTYYFIWFSFVNVSQRLRKYSHLEVEAILAHEMGHIVRFSNCNIFGQLWKGFRYFTSKNVRTLEENSCDNIAIERGYARGLFSFKSKKCKKRKYGDCYLSAKQVKQYAKEIGKW